MQVDILAFGPHPDDIEIGAGATIAKAVRQGQAVGLCDLTRGELGSNGTVEERLAEAGAAAETLGATWRENLGWPDGAIGGDDQLRAAVELLRRSRPATVLIPYWDDRHPDHVAASRLLASAVFKARLRRFGAPGEAWSPDWVCHYYINNAGTPSFVVDVSADYDSKRRALDCHRSRDASHGIIVSSSHREPRRRVWRGHRGRVGGGVRRTRTVAAGRRDEMRAARVEGS